MKNAMIIVAALAMAGLSGCTSSKAQNVIENEHHQYALAHCVAETNTADAALKEMYSKDPSLTNTLDQRGHDYRAAVCMSEEEKTTIDFQREKHDDYGKCDQCAREAVAR